MSIEISNVQKLGIVIYQEAWDNRKRIAEENASNANPESFVCCIRLERSPALG